MKFDDYLNGKNKYNKNYNRFKQEKNINIKFNETKDNYKNKILLSFNKKALLTLCCSFIIIIAFISVIVLDDSTSEGPKYPIVHVENKDKDLRELKSNLNSNRLLGLASFKEFDIPKETNKKTLKRNYRSNIIYKEDKMTEFTEFYKSSYPYDYIKIHNATKFEFELKEDNCDEGLELIKQNCGYGILEVSIAYFSIYEIINSNTGKLSLLETELMISFKGELGIYTCLTLGGKVSSNISGNNGEEHLYTVFSSHKRISSEEISKDLTPPIYCIMVDETIDSIQLTFHKGEKINHTQFLEMKNELSHYNVDLETVKTVEKDTLYDVYELAKFSETSQLCIIEEFDLENKTIKVVSEQNLKIILIDSYTYYNSEGNVDVMSNLEIGVEIEVYYDYLYDGYNPLSVYGNNIIIQIGDEVNEE